MHKRVLMIAYHFPPVSGSSGLQRTLKFCRYLRNDGWQPTVLTIDPRAYSVTGSDQLGEIPPDVEVVRAWGLDSARQLSIRGKYPELFCIPDRWSSWFIGGVLASLRLHRRYRFDAMWSTYPIATAHLIGLALHRSTGLPWVADFRDTMTDDGFPAPGRQRRAYRWIERRTVHAADAIVFTAPGSRTMYRDRYPDVAEAKWRLIRNGYDEDNFSSAASSSAQRETSGARPKVLVHSGTLYPNERDPRAFLDALSRLHTQGEISADSLRVVLRATGHDDYLQPLIDAAGLTGIVRLEPGIPYNSALQEMLGADGLIIFQAANCNHQIPAKLYEYLRAGRPILCLSDPRGDTAGTLRLAGIDSIFDIADTVQIENGLQDFLKNLKTDTATLPNANFVAQCSRESQSRELTQLLHRLAGN